MGYPAAGLASLYRNPRSAVLGFLEKHHQRDWHIYNFCPLSENSYPHDVFYNQVSRFPFPDQYACKLLFVWARAQLTVIIIAIHRLLFVSFTQLPKGTKLRLQLQSLIPLFVNHITGYLASDPKHTAVIHCKAGKGRSGILIFLDSVLAFRTDLLLKRDDDLLLFAITP